MNRFISSMAVALACATFGGATLAQDKSTSPQKADKTKVTPGKKEAPKTAEPSVETMDDNAQRAHDRNKTAGAKDPAAARRAPTAVGEVRDWRAIDKNRDNLISPEEMEASLKQGASPGAKASTKP